MNRKIKLLMKKAKKDTNDIHSLEILTAILFANFALVDESFHYSIPEYYRNIKIKKDDIDDMLTETMKIRGMHVQKNYFYKRIGSNSLIS